MYLCGAKMVIGWLGAISMQGNPVRVRNCTCSCNPLKHRVCLLNVTGREHGWEGKAGWGKVRRPAITVNSEQLTVNSWFHINSDWELGARD